MSYPTIAVTFPAQSTSFILSSDSHPTTGSVLGQLLAYVRALDCAIADVTAELAALRAPIVEVVTTKCKHGLREDWCATCKEQNDDGCVDSRGTAKAYKQVKKHRKDQVTQDVLYPSERIVYEATSPAVVERRSVADGDKLSDTLQVLFHHKKVQFHQVTPEDVAWAERQTAFPHTRTMPRLFAHFCPNCFDAVVDGDTRVRVTKGVFLEKEHECCVRVFNLAGELVKVESRAEFDANTVASVQRVICQENKAATFKPSRSVEWRQTSSPMAKLMRLCVTVHEMLKDKEIEAIDIWETTDAMPYKEAVRCLKACWRWLTEKKMVVNKSMRSEVRSLDDILSDSRLFPN
jgi:hypothetical protein